MRYFSLLLCLLFSFCYGLFAQETPPPTSGLVSPDPVFDGTADEGRLVYVGYTNQAQTVNDPIDPADPSITHDAATYGNNLMIDFSHAGYMGGGIAIPWVPVVKTLDPDPNIADDYVRIQAAINDIADPSSPDYVPLDANGFRGAILLRAGTYNVSQTLVINDSGIVIRGEGQHAGGTVIRFTANIQDNLFHFLGNGGWTKDTSSEVDIIEYETGDVLIPSGARSFNVSNSNNFQLGDRIIVNRTPNQAWIDLLDMAQYGWTFGAYSAQSPRTIVDITGNTITVDAPLVHAIESRYGGGTVYKYSFNSIQQVGIERLRLESDFAGETDENHGWNAVLFQRVENAWARQVTAKYFGYSCVNVDERSQYVTVEDCAQLDPKSLISGGRRYSFNIDDSTFILVQRCYTREGRHDFVTGSKPDGPNVFLDSLAVNAYSDIGPHQRYAIGLLFDNVKGKQINVKNRGSAGSGHGWAGAQTVFWNCYATDSFICDAPEAAMNFSIGSVGSNNSGTLTGIWESAGTPVEPSSLYLQQLTDRLGNSGFNNVTIPSQQLGSIWGELENWQHEQSSPITTASAPVTEPLTATVSRPLSTPPDVPVNDAGWQVLSNSGEGTVTFTDPDSTTTNASFDQYGTYLLAYKQVETLFSGSSLLSLGDIRDFIGLATKLKNAGVNDGSVSGYLKGRLAAGTITLLNGYVENTTPSDALEDAIIADLKSVLEGASIYDSIFSVGVTLRQATNDLMAQSPTGDDLVRLNRLLLEDAYPVEIARNPLEVTYTGFDTVRVYVPANGTLLNTANFSTIGTITDTTPELVFDTDSLAVSGGLEGYGVLNLNSDNSEVAVFVFDSVNLTTPPVIFGSRPIVIASRGDLTVSTTISVKGGNGSHEAQGVGIAGGGDGGDAVQANTGDPFDGQGPGRSPSSAEASGGGGFGGNGGDSSGFAGSSYGNLDLSALFVGGSGAGGTITKGGGAGGGAIGLAAGGNLVITARGVVDVRGGSSASSDTKLTSGGGSGGAILISGRTVTLNGTLNARGGNGGNASGGQANGGGGGGGRIAVYYQDAYSKEGNVTVDGGQPFGTNTIGKPGGNGSIYESQFFVANAGSNQVVVDSEGDSELVTLNGSASLAGVNATNIVSYEWFDENGSLIANSAQHTVDLSLGEYTFTLIITDDQGVNQSDTVTVTVNAVNSAPLANPGPDQTLAFLNGQTSRSVTLDGSGSYDVENAGSIASYQWLDASDNVIATTATTTVDLGTGTYTYKLTVTDNNGAFSEATVTIQINASNTLPIANAGSNQDIDDTDNDGSVLVTLDGSSSSDSETDGSISYQWLNASDVEIATGVSPTISLGIGANVLTLRVTDGQGATDEDTVTIIVNDLPPAKPVGLSAIGDNGSVILSWTGNTEIDLQSYRVYRSTTSGSNFVEIVEIAAVPDTPFRYVDNSVDNGTTYYYTVAAVDLNNEPIQSDEVSATPNTGLITVFGAKNDGLDGFTPSTPSNGLESWFLESESYQYANGQTANTGLISSSLHKGFTLDRSVGSSYTIEGRVDFTRGYSEDNNRVGIYLFGDVTNSEVGGLCLLFNFEAGALQLAEGINGTVLVSGANTKNRDDSFFGENKIATFTAVITFLASGNIQIDGSFSANYEDALSSDPLTEFTANLTATVSAANYAGDYFGFSARSRKRGTVGKTNPFIMDYRSFRVTTDSLPPNQPPVFTSNPIVEANVEDGFAYSATIADDASDPNFLDTLTFSTVPASGPAWLTVAPDGTLSGTPGSTDVGLNSWTVEVSDGNGGSDQAALNITVLASNSPPAPPVSLSAEPGNQSVSLDWMDNTEGDLASYNVYRSETAGSGYTDPAIATSITLSEYLDDTTIGNTTYYYVVTAVDSNGNESEDSNEASAMPAGGVLPLGTTVFGSNDDGFGGFTKSTTSDQENWSEQADSVRYTNNGSAGGGTENSSLLGKFILDRSVGKSYVIEGVVNLTDGYADDNNRVGIYLFGDVPDLAAPGGFEQGETGALCLLYNFDTGQVRLHQGIDQSLITSISNNNRGANDQTIFGTTVTFTATISFLVSGDIQIEGTFEDVLGETVLNGTVAASTYTGDYFGFATRARNRGGANLPFVMDYKSFSVIDNSAPGNQPPVFTTNTIVESDATEDAPYSGSIAGYASDPEGDPMTFSKVSGPAWLSVAADGTLSGTPTNDDVRLNSFTVEVTALGGSEQATLNITVNDVNNLPTWNSDPFSEANAYDGIAYDQTIADNASDADGDPLTFTKISRDTGVGQDWLTVASNGDLSGMPDSLNLGEHRWTVEVSDGNSIDTAVLVITVETQPTSTDFTNADGTDSYISNSANWSAGLPINGVPGMLAINATFEGGVSHDGYDVVHTDGALSRIGIDPFTLGAGTTWEMNGANAEISNSRGINVDGATFILNQGTANLTNNERDSIIQAGGEIIINGGTMDMGRYFYLNGGELTVNGGSLIGITDMGSRDFHSGGTANLNGGTISATYLTFGTDSFNVNFGGTTAGSLTIENFGGNRANTNVIGINFDPGTLMSMQLTNPVESGISGDGDLGWSNVGAETGLDWAPALWENGRLTFDGKGSADFGNWATVTSTGFVGYGVRFAYDSATNTLSIAVAIANDVPVANADSYSVNEGDTLTVPAAGVLSNDTDADGNTLTAILVASPSNSATFTLNSDGSFNYTHDGSETTEDSFTYVANDGIVDSATATVTITVNPLNDAPSITSDAVTAVDEDVLYTYIVTTTDPDAADSVTVSASIPAESSWLSFDGTTLSGTPENADVGGHVIELTATDSAGLTDVQSFTITVNNINDAPVANADVAATDEDTPVIINVLANDSDVDDGDTFSITATADGSSGTTTTDGSTVTYTPNADYVGSDSFTYTISDGNLTTNATVTITINPVNDAPVAVIDSATTDEDNPVTVDVVSAGTDVDGDTLIISTFTQGSNGSVIDNLDGTLTYTPVENFSGTDSFDYTLSDGDLTASATVTITVTAVNDAPTSISLSSATISVPEDEDTTAPVKVADVVVEDDGLGTNELSLDDNSIFEIVGTELFLKAGVSLNFETAPSLSVTVTVDDTTIGSTPDGSVLYNLSITDVNEAPVAVDDTGETDEDTAVTIDVLANDSDVDAGDTLSITATPDGSNGTTTTNGSTVTYTPNADYVGSDSFTYTVSDGDLTASATVTVTVNPVNDAPVAVIDSATTDEGNPVTIDVLANDSDVDTGDTLSITATTDGSNGTTTTDGSTVTYTPNADYAGSDSFTYTMSDGALTASTTVTVTVNPVNDAPTSISLSSATISVPEDEDTTAPVKVADVVVEDDGLGTNELSLDDNSIFEIVGTELFLKAGVSLDYETSPSLSVTVTVDDTTVGSTPDGSVVYNLSITDVNEAPVAVVDSATTDEGTAVTIDVLANDSDVDAGDTLSITVTTDGSNGTTTTDGSTVTYTPNADYAGSDSFAYTISDGALTASATVTITVTAVNDAPTSISLSSATISLPENADTTASVKVADVVVEDDGLGTNELSLDDNSIFEIVGTELFLKAGVSLDYETSPSLSVTVTVDDTTVGSTPDGSVVYNLSITDVNEAPVAVFDTGETDEDTAVTIDVLANDSDVDAGDTFSITATADGISGTTTTDGLTVTYTPNADYVGSDSFTYTISDGNLTTNATVAITINPVNDAPVAVINSATTDEGNPVTVDVVSAGTDVDGDTLIISTFTQGSNGSVIDNFDGTLTYTPVENFSGTDSFGYTLSDGDLTASATVTITVTAVNDAPVASAGSDQTLTDTDNNGSESVTLDGSGSSDSDGTIATYSWSEGGTEIATGVSPTVSLAVGVHTLTLTVTDNDGATASDTVIITVNAAPTMYVHSIELQKIDMGKGRKKARVLVAIYNGQGNPLSGATVTVELQGDYNETLTGTTDASGVVVLDSNAAVKGKISYTASVINVTHPTNSYDSDSNVVISASH